MKIAAIASDEAILPVLEAIQLWEDGEVTHIWGDEDSLRQRMQAMTPAGSSLSTWDALVEQDSVDFILLAGVSESILSAARQLLQTGKRFLIVVSSDQETARIFEYTALWQEAADRVLPIFSSGVDEIAQSLLRQFDRDKLGQLWKVNFKRTIEPSDSNAKLTLDTAQKWFLQDCSWIRKIDPVANLVTMTTTGPDPEHPIEVNVRLTGENGLDTDWTITCGNETGWQLEMIGENGKFVTRCLNNQQLSIEGADELSPSVHPNYLFADIQRQLENLKRGEPDLDWTDLIKLGEFGATANRSLLKKRTYPVHFEEASERSQFKSQMAAFGCGALLWAMFGMITLLAIGAIADPRDREYLTSSSADYVIWDNEFSDAEATELTEIGKDHIRKIAATWSSTSPVVIIEETQQTANAIDDINRERLNSVVERLSELGVKEPGSRVTVRPITGQWFETVMLIGWVFVFLPVGLVFVAQSLLVISRPIQ